MPKYKVKVTVSVPFSRIVGAESRLEAIDVMETIVRGEAPSYIGLESISVEEIEETDSEEEDEEQSDSEETESEEESG